MEVPMEMNIGIPEGTRSAISDGLSRILAESYALYLKTQNFHWNVRGPDFFSLHLLFEKQYLELAEEVDEIAERIRALGLFVDASFSAFNELSSIKEETKVLNEKEMIASLVAGHELWAKDARKVAEIGDRELDFATVDMLGRRIGAHEKMAWFLRSHL